MLSFKRFLRFTTASLGIGLLVLGVQVRSEQFPLLGSRSSEGYSGIVVGPGSRLAWDQPERPEGTGTEELVFWLVVDGEPRQLEGVSCEAPELGDAPCEVPLPRLEPGLHTIALAVASGNDSASERAESDTFTVVVNAWAEPTASASRRPVASDDIKGPLALSTPVISGLDDATDFVLLADRRILVAERSGLLRLVDQNGASDQETRLPAPELVVGGGRGLLSIAAADDFATTGLLFALYSTVEGLELARFRLVGGALGERSVVASAIPSRAVQPRAVVRLGPSELIYVSLDDAGRPDRAHSAGDFAGKLLGLNGNGTTPRPRTSPVLLGGLEAPLSMAIGDAAVWLLDGTNGHTTTLRWVAPGPAAVELRSVELPGDATAMVPLESGGPARVALAAINREIVRVTMTSDTAPGLERIGAAPFLDDVRALAVDSSRTLYALTSTALIRTAVPAH